MGSHEYACNRTVNATYSIFNSKHASVGLNKIIIWLFDDIYETSYSTSHIHISYMFENVLKLLLHIKNYFSIGKIHFLNL